MISKHFSEYLGIAIWPNSIWKISKNSLRWTAKKRGIFWRENSSSSAFGFPKSSCPDFWRVPGTLLLSIRLFQLNDSWRGQGCFFTVSKGFQQKWCQFSGAYGGSENETLKKGRVFISTQHISCIEIPFGCSPLSRRRFSILPSKRWSERFGRLHFPLAMEWNERK